MAISRSLRRVRKRDGNNESFDIMKLADSVSAALASVGANFKLALQFSETIQVRLAEKDEVVTTVELAASCCEVLRAYDQCEAADAFLQCRVEEVQAIADIRVIDDNEGLTHFDRARLALSFVRDQYIDSSVARLVARRVERRLSFLGYVRISCNLIASLSDVESHSLGMRSISGKSSLLGVDRSSLNAWLGGACIPSQGRCGALPQLGPESQDLRPLIGEEVLSRFALEDVLNTAHVNSWKAGEFDLYALGDWLRPTRMWLHPESTETEELFFKRVAASRSQAHEVQVFVPRSLAISDLAVQAPTWLQSSACRLRFSTSSPELANKWATNSIWHSMPVSSFMRLSLPDSLRLVELGHTSVQWQPPRPMPNESDRRCRTLHRGAAINLALLATQVDAFDTDAFLERVTKTLSLICDVFATLALRAEHIDHPRVTIVPAGLEQALDILYPDSRLRVVKCSQLVLSLRSRFESIATQSEVRFEYTLPPHSQSMGARLAERDNLNLCDAYDVSWATVDSDASLKLALDSAPWLELPAALLHNSTLRQRLQPQIKSTQTSPSDDSNACT
ncbi:MAG: hypothetical protein H8E25_09830 [Planctomycetes bacterium]|nr:hypothetical protein [Planctomycetota bacterium]